MIFEIEQKDIKIHIHIYKKMKSGVLILKVLRCLGLTYQPWQQNYSFISRWRLAEQRIGHYSKSPDPGQGHQKNQAEKSPKMAIKIHPFFVMNIASKSTSKKNKEQLPSCSNSQISATSPVINSSKIFQF